MAFGVSVMRTHRRAVSACFVRALARSVSILCLLYKRHLASKMRLEGVGGAWRAREVVGKKVVLRKVISRYELSARLQLSDIFQDTPRRRRKLLILGGKMGLFVFLSVCMNYVNTQMLSFVLGK